MSITAMTAAMVFATIVPLIGLFKQETDVKDTKGFEAFMKWMIKSNHAEIVQYVLNTQELLNDVNELLKEDIGKILSMLDVMGKSIEHIIILGEKNLAVSEKILDTVTVELPNVDIRDEFKRRIYSNEFHELSLIKPGLLIVAIEPVSKAESLDISNVPPIGTLSNYNVFNSNQLDGDRIYSYANSLYENWKGRDAVTEMTEGGCIYAASHSIISNTQSSLVRSNPELALIINQIPCKSYEKMIVNRLSEWLAVLNNVGVKGPFNIGIGIINAKCTEMLGSDSIPIGEGGKKIKEKEILPKMIQISTCVVDPFDIAMALRSSFDFIWKKHGIRRSYNYEENGNWKY